MWVCTFERCILTRTCGTTHLIRACGTTYLTRTCGTTHLTRTCGTTHPCCFVSRSYLQGQRTTNIADALATLSPFGPPSPAPPAPEGSGPPGFGKLWKAKVSANLTQPGYDAGLVIVNFTTLCGDNPHVQMMRTVYGRQTLLVRLCCAGIVGGQLNVTHPHARLHTTRVRPLTCLTRARTCSLAQTILRLRQLTRRPSEANGSLARMCPQCRGLWATSLSAPLQCNVASLSRCQ
jgi:hypothetical protein